MPPIAGCSAERVLDHRGLQLNMADSCSLSQAAGQRGFSQLLPAVLILCILTLSPVISCSQVPLLPLNSVHWRLQFLVQSKTLPALHLCLSRSFAVFLQSSCTSSSHRISSSLGTLPPGVERIPSAFSPTPFILETHWPEEVHPTREGTIPILS